MDLKLHFKRNIINSFSHWNSPWNCQRNVKIHFSFGNEWGVSPTRPEQISWGYWAAEMRPVRGRVQPAGERTIHLGKTSVRKLPQCRRLWDDAEEGLEGRRRLGLEPASSFGMCSRHPGKKLPAEGPVPSLPLAWKLGTWTSMTREGARPWIALGWLCSLHYSGDAAGKRKTTANLYFLLSSAIERAEEGPLQLWINLNSSYPALYKVGNQSCEEGSVSLWKLLLQGTGGNWR